MKAIYHQPGGSIELDVVKDHKNGTVDLGRAEQVLVEKVRVGDENKAHGTCTLGKAPRKAKGKDDKPDPKAIEAAKAALETAEKAFAADPSEANGKAVDEAREALTDLQD